MKINYCLQSSLIPLILAVASVNAQSQPKTDPYVPVYVDCPKNLTVRNASEGLSSTEQTWRNNRTKVIIPALQSYLELAKIPNFDVQNFTKQLNSSNVPVVGLSISGGGTQSGLGGLGIWQAYDARYPAAVTARTGGLTQILTYISGLSGGGVVTVALVAANNFSTVDTILQTANFSMPFSSGPTGNSTAFYNQIFENTGAKAQAGFPVSVTDPFGQLWGTWLPKNKTFSNYSDLALPGNAFSMGQAPMPIMELAEVIPGNSPEIHSIMYPGFNSTNGFNLTTYEVTPFEFGSWTGGRIQAFMPTEYLGTSMNNGTAQNRSQCVRGFDKLTFIQGTTAGAFPAWFIDDFYNIPVFAKRELEGRQSPSQLDDIPVPADQLNNPLVQLVNLTATSFNQTFNQSMWGTYPNPFENYNEEMKNVDELLLLDGSLTGETNPIRPLIIPERKVDFVIVYEATSDAKYNWNNGTNIINSALSAHEGGIPFPTMPDVNTMVSQNLTRQPTFFGCNASVETPLVLYLPNSPWSAYANFSYMQASFTPNQFNVTLENAFQIATYGNGTIDAEWPVCLACATIMKSLGRLGMNMPAQCTQCFDRHCWNGKNSTANITDAESNPRLKLNENLSFLEWNDTVWTNGKLGEDRKKHFGNGGDDDDSDDDSNDGKVLRSKEHAGYAAMVGFLISALFW